MPDDELIWKQEWGGSIFFCHGTSKARGVMLCVKKEFASCIENVLPGEDGRSIVFDVSMNGISVTCIAIYAPNDDKPDFFRNLSILLQGRGEHKILIGDFNLTLDVELDRLNTYCNNNKAKEEVENLMEQYFLKDVWRNQNEGRKEYSWFKRSERESKASRIDIALVSGGLDQRVEYIQYLSSIKTDHRAIYMVVNCNENERGSGYWKFNSDLLTKKPFLDYMNQELMTSIQSTIQKAPIERWEIIKGRIKRATKKFTRMNASEEKLIIGQLAERVNEYEENFPLNRDEDDIYERTKIELEEKLFERTKGLMFRSKVKWYEQGEKNSKYFYSLEKARYNAKTCFKLVVEGKEIENQEQILQYQKDFYQELYEEDKEVKFTLKNNYGIYVPEDIVVLQEEQITAKEVREAMMQMNNNKTPGEDGIPVDFYKVFWSQIQQVFMDMLFEVYRQNKLHSTARKGILNLIPKANKDTRQIKNLRPITLLNTDYKIIEKVIANKMIPALEHIINRDQRGFMKERRISVNIRKMLDIIHEAEKEDLEAVIMSLDFVKCFDKCSFSILHGSLEFFGFGSIVREWTKILYDDFSVRIQNNGYFSSEIAIKKGVHQGGCCSSIYFLVVAEILALALRTNKDIEGITIKDIKNILNQFADDMDIFSTSSEKITKGHI